MSVAVGCAKRSLAEDGPGGVQAGGAGDALLRGVAALIGGELHVGLFGGAADGLAVGEFGVARFTVRGLAVPVAPGGQRAEDVSLGAVRAEPGGEDLLALGSE